MIYEVIGWAGSLAILFAYWLVSANKVSSKSREYQLLNLIGAIGISVNSMVHRAYPSVGLNVVWLLIAIYGLTKVVE